MVTPIRECFGLGGFRFLGGAVLGDVTRGEGLARDGGCANGSSEIFFGVGGRLPRVATLRGDVDFTTAIHFISIFVWGLHGHVCMGVNSVFGFHRLFFN